MSETTQTLTLYRPVGPAGYVTRFNVRADFARRYPVQTVGGSVHQELWVPAAKLAEFNANLVGLIEVIAEFRRGEE